MAIPVLHRPIAGGGDEGFLGVPGIAANIKAMLARQGQVQRQIVKPTIVAGVTKAEQKTHVLRVQRFAQELGFNINDDGIPGPLTYGLTLTFQRGMCLGPYWDQPLKPDAAPGPATSAALDFSAANGYRCAQDFKWVEFESKNPDQLITASNPVLILERDTVRLTQATRTYTGIAFTPVSAYRDPYWNQIVKGAPESQHMLGKAIDIENTLLGLTEATIRYIGRSIGVATMGVGVVGATGFVAHFDCRGVDTTWYY